MPNGGHDNNNGLFNALQKVVKRVPLGAWLALGGQFVGFGYWLIQIELRGAENTHKIATIMQRLDGIDQAGTRAAQGLIERVNATDRDLNRRLTEQAERMNRIVQALDNMYTTQMTGVEATHNLERLEKRVEELEKRK